ncbi:RICIN domain-containing protein [Nocardioides sp. LML1-1-1.1]|uniref:RICIN domain-containing protein n=1 Tax=Nocardioides sp. LML1-1-1.1 TaxID=3135248 RepID=UPI00344A7CD4
MESRSPGFEVLVQQSDGSFHPVAAPAERSYLGSVDGLPSALAAGILRSDGKVEGAIVFDRGGTWSFLDEIVTSTRGLTQPDTFQWPSAAEAARNVTVAPGQVGGTTYRWDVGYDLAHRWFSDPDTVNSSVARALDHVELNTVLMLAAYEVDARLRPATGRVVIRGSATAEPYTGYENLLDKVTTEWQGAQADADVDAAALWHGGPGGAGVAWNGTISSGSGTSSNSGFGTPWGVTRHEIGHNWGAHDNHTKGPEGPTIESGNQYHRFDGTELSAIIRKRDQRLAWDAPPFPAVAPLSEPVPPYAALDLVEHQTSGIPYSFRPTANDHDANGGRLMLRSIRSESHLGGTLARSGNVVTYVPPATAEPVTDWVTYVVEDPSGRRATGVAMFAVESQVDPGPVANWPAVPVEGARDYRLVNTQSGLPASRSTAGRPVQARAKDTTARFAIHPAGSFYRFKHSSGRCLATAPRGRLVLERCRAAGRQKFTVVSHPVVGEAVVSAATGRCVAPSKRSILAGARLKQVRCGLELTSSWHIEPSAVDRWKAIVPPTEATGLIQNASGLFAGVPDGASGNTGLLLREASGPAAQVTFTHSDNGTWQIASAATGRCFDAYDSDEGGQVGTWTCAPQDNQQWRVLRNPAGGMSLRLMRGGLCLGAADVTVGSGLEMRACDFSEGVRWSLR